MVQRITKIAPEAACFVGVGAFYFVHLLYAGYDRFYFDSAQYWLLGTQFENSGEFSLLSYHDIEGRYARGYSLPLLNYVLQTLAEPLGLSDLTIVRLWGALVAATLGVIVLPRLARRLFPEASVAWPRVLALNVLVFLFWRDHFAFPLSDFPALLASSVALLGLLRATASGYAVAGLGFGLAINMRPAYLPALLGAVAVVGLAPPRRSLGRRGFALFILLAYALVASLPQMMSNHVHRDSWSPATAGGADIAELQLTASMKIQRYETFIGSPTEYPRAAVRYFDPATTRVMQLEGISKVTTYGQFARIVIRHPTEMAVGYARRIFNGLDVWYPTPYVRDLGDRSPLLSLFQYTLMFLAILRLLVPSARDALGRANWAGVAVLISPCLTAIPTAPEPRFFLPLQSLIYMVVCFGPATRRMLLVRTVGQQAALAASYVLFVALCLYLSSATLARIEHPDPTLGQAKRDLSSVH